MFPGIQNFWDLLDNLSWYFQGLLSPFLNFLNSIQALLPGVKLLVQEDFKVTLDKSDTFHHLRVFSLTKSLPGVAVATIPEPVKYSVWAGLRKILRDFPFREHAQTQCLLSYKLQSQLLLSFYFGPIVNLLCSCFCPFRFAPNKPHVALTMDALKKNKKRIMTSCQEDQEAKK